LIYFTGLKLTRVKHKTEGQFWAETLISLNIIMTMGQEILEPVETNDIGKVKIASLAKIGKWEPPGGSSIGKVS
jgi:hypothetical protein